MDRKITCMALASACRAKAEADSANRDYWMDEAIKWLERAVTSTGGVAITCETKDGHRIQGSRRVHSTVTDD